MIKSKVTHDLSSWNIPITPKDILQNEIFDSIAENQIEIDEDSEGSSLTYGGPPYKLSKWRYMDNCEHYLELREYFQERLKETGVTSEDFLAEVGKLENS